MNEFNQYAEYKHELTIDGYIHYIEGLVHDPVTGGDMDHIEMRITPNGIAFINNGGYTAQEKNQATPLSLTKVANIIAAIALVVSIVALAKSWTDTKAENDLRVHIKKDSAALKKFENEITDLATKIKQMDSLL